MSFKVYLSYAKSDELEAARLSEMLKHRGLVVGLGDRVQVGKPWSDAILQALKDADAIVAFVPGSSESRSNNVFVEIGAASSLGKPIFMVADPDEAVAISATMSLSKARLFASDMVSLDKLADEIGGLQTAA